MLREPARQRRPAQPARRHGARDRAAPTATGCVFEVADEGPGIPPEQRDRVFERFTRGERAGGGGTGLGLAIARWVVQLHGGTIAVVDRPAGCLLRVSLPAGAPAHPESKAMAA